jgi:hypothetical protein
MTKVLLAALSAGFSLLCPVAVRAQTAVNACDLNHDGVVNVLDIQLAVNMVLGFAPCTANVTSPGVCDIVMIQRVTNAAVSGNCITGLVVHSVALAWTASTSTNVTGYNVYRGTQSGGPYTKINPSPVAATGYTDTAAQAGATYYYVTTAIDSNNNESAYSNEAQAVIPAP